MVRPVQNVGVQQVLRSLQELTKMHADVKKHRATLTIYCSESLSIAENHAEAYDSVQKRIQKRPLLWFIYAVTSDCSYHAFGSVQESLGAVHWPQKR